jgi:hypothetical protein
MSEKRTPKTIPGFGKSFALLLIVPPDYSGESSNLPRYTSNVTSIKEPAGQYGPGYTSPTCVRNEAVKG